MKFWLHRLIFCMKAGKMGEMRDIKQTCQKTNCYEAKGGPKNKVSLSDDCREVCSLPTGKRRLHRPADTGVLLCIA